MAAHFGEPGKIAWFKFINVGTVHTVNLNVKIQMFTRRAFAKSRDKAHLE
jgi:hypothetical protein